MMEAPSSRGYVRTDNWSVDAKVSKEKDAEDWIPVGVPNIAAGGLLFTTDNEFEIGDELWISLMIDPLTPGITSKIPMTVKGAVNVDRGKTAGKHSYAIRFIEISNNDQVRLDELIRLTNYAGHLAGEADIFDR